MTLGDYVKKNDKSRAAYYSQFSEEERAKEFGIPTKPEDKLVPLQKSALEMSNNAITDPELRNFIAEANDLFSRGVTLKNDETMTVDAVIKQLEDYAAAFYENDKFLGPDQLPPEQVINNYNDIMRTWGNLMNIIAQTTNEKTLPANAMKKYIGMLDTKKKEAEKLLSQSQVPVLRIKEQVDNKMKTTGGLLYQLSYIGNMLKGLYLEAVGYEMLTHAKGNVAYVTIPLGQILNVKGKQLSHDLLVMTQQVSQASLSEKIKFRVGKDGHEEQASTWEEFLQRIEKAVADEKTVTLVNQDILKDLQGTIQAKAASGDIRLKNTKTNMEEFLAQVQGIAAHDTHVWALQTMAASAASTKKNEGIFVLEHEHYNFLSNLILSKSLNYYLQDKSKIYLLRTGFKTTNEMIKEQLDKGRYVHSQGKTHLKNGIGSIVISVA